jgi:hypothetical protein
MADTKLSALAAAVSIADTDLLYAAVGGVSKSVTPAVLRTQLTSVTLPVTAGGTGATTLTAHGVLIGAGTSAVAITGAGTSGQVLTSNGASADPTFQAASGANPAGSGSEINARSNATTFQAVTGSSTTSGGIALVEQTAANVPLSVTGAASQSGDLLQLTANGGTAGALFKIGSAGRVFIPNAGNASAPQLQIGDASTGYGFFRNSADDGTVVYLATNSVGTFSFRASGYMGMISGGTLFWTNSSTSSNIGSGDTGITRSAPKVIAFGDSQSNANGWYNYAGTSRVTADVTNATATMAAITGLSAALIAGRAYQVTLSVKCVNSAAAEGIQFDFNGGAATATDFWMAAGILASGGTDVVGTNISTTLGGAINFTTFTGESVVTFTGYIKCNAAGTFIPRMAENTTAVGTATVRKGSWMTLVDVP